MIPEYSVQSFPFSWILTSSIDLMLFQFQRKSLSEKKDSGENNREKKSRVFHHYAIF